MLAVGYGAYASVRNARGGVNAASLARAIRHADGVARLESSMGLHLESSIQNWFMHVRPAVEVLDVFYATAHVLVTTTALISLWWLAPSRYRQARTALLIATAIALVAFAVFPTAPPRMVPGIGARDTLASVGGLWSFRTPMIERISDPLAAMPSLHMAWALWCTLAIWPLCRQRLARVAAASYPAVVVTVVVVTGNHWILDVFAGALVGMAGWLAAALLWSRRLRAGAVDAAEELAPLTDPRPIPVPVAARAAT